MGDNSLKRLRRGRVQPCPCEDCLLRRKILPNPSKILPILVHCPTAAGGAEVDTDCGCGYADYC